MVHGEVNICVEYKVKLPIPLPGNYSAKYAENIKMSAWNGYQDGEDTEGEDELVCCLVSTVFLLTERT